MRATTRFGALAVAALATLSFPPPTQAAQSNTILVGAIPGLSVTRTYWQNNDCSQAARALVNGKDAAIFDVGGRPVGTVLSIKWSGVFPPGGFLVPTLIDSRCRPISTQGGGSLSGTGPASGTMTVRIPSPATWLIVEGFMVANVSLTMA